MATLGRNSDTPMTSAWYTATLVSSELASSNVKKLVFSVPEWPGHKAGQHVDIRLTSEGGYVAERSYSIANAPGGTLVELGVELLENGEVSPYLWHIEPGAQIELRGPIGGHFIWDTDTSGPLVLVAGGAGLVPLMSMLRLHAREEKPGREIVLIISMRSIDKLLYAKEIESIAANDTHVRVVVTLTETVPEGWNGYSRRIDPAMFETELSSVQGKSPDIYVCGPTKFVEAAASILIKLGYESGSIRTERFGG
jgi:ferredoxin-NADP reductase